MPTLLPSACFRLLLNLAAVQNILVLLQWLSVQSVQRGHTQTGTHVYRHTLAHAPSYHAAYFLLLALFSYFPQQKDEVSSQLEVTPVD